MIITQVSRMLRRGHQTFVMPYLTGYHSMMENPSRLITFDMGKSAIKLFLSVIHIKGKLLLSVNTGYKLRNFARTVTEC